MSVYIGLDVSSVVVGAVAIFPEGFEVFALPLSKDHKEGAWDAFSAAHDIIDPFVTRFGSEFVYVYMEEPFVFAGRPGATIPQAHCQGGVMAAVAQLETHFEQINNKTVKARIVKNGNAKKEEVAEMMQTVWPEMVEVADKHGKFKQDVIDAGMIALYAKGAVELRGKVSRHLSRKG